MKTFRCVFQIGKNPKTVDVTAPDPLAAASKILSQDLGPALPRIEFQDERGNWHVAPAPAYGPALGRVRVFPLKAA